MVLSGVTFTEVTQEMPNILPELLLSHVFSGVLLPEDSKEYI